MQLNYKWLAAASSAFTVGRNGATVQTLIWHDTEGHCTGDIPTLTGHDAGHLVSVHWYIERDGTIYHFVADADTAFHAGIVDAPEHDNHHSIGVEHEHIQNEDWPDAQIQSSALVYCFLHQQYPLAEIVHHAAVATFTMGGSDYGRKTDPDNWPSDRFWSAVAVIGNEYIEPVQI